MFSIVQRHERSFQKHDYDRDHGSRSYKNNDSKRTYFRFSLKIMIMFWSEMSNLFSLPSIVHSIIYSANMDVMRRDYVVHIFIVRNVKIKCYEIVILNTMIMQLYLFRGIFRFLVKLLIWYFFKLNDVSMFMIG